MRVIAGILKGRRLAAVRGDVRPTSDRLRESLFNVLGASVRGTVWLDLFAGTGAVGIEALSRGAEKVIFNDRDPKAVELLRRNLTLCGITEGFEIHQKDAFALLSGLKLHEPISVVFLDPPYGYRRYERLLTRLAATSVLDDDVRVVLEFFHKTSLDFVPATFRVERVLESGDSRLAFLTRSPRES